MAAATTTTLLPYLPRIVLEWARTEPEARRRELEGTMAFVDVSGFTAMSERLSRAGKAGAEELTGVMNTAFERLLELAYAEGGSLLKFGGDALLLFFDGEGHAPRAARAAFSMRRALRELGGLRTSAGAVTLRMHVGIHSGRFHFFLVGDSHRELIITGPAASSTVAMEETSEAGEIVLSQETAELVDRRILGAPKGEGRLLRSAPAGIGLLAPLPEAEGIALERYIPAAIRPALATTAIEPEHRNAAVGFLRFAGADTLLAREGIDALTAAVDELVRTVQSAADAHGVCFLETYVERDGGRIVLVAGAPQASENDEERLLRTVRAIVEANDISLQLHVGVNRGRVFTGEVGASFRRTYAILGDTAALAARLMAHAGPGEVLAAADVMERSRTLFATSPLEPFRVKGKSEPVSAVAVGPVEGSREVRKRRRLPMVDRERELAVLGATLAPVRMGFGSLVELVGDAGIGKSRLVEEIREQSTDMAQVATACERYEASTPYFAFRDLLRSLLGVDLDGSPAENSERLRARLESVAPDLVPWIPLLALPLDAEVTPTREADELEPAFRRARVHGAVTSLLTSVLDQPTLMLFEDVHWMDEASSELLRHLGTQLAARPWFACATRRPVQGGFSAAQGTPPLPALTLRLDPLPAADARKLAETAAVSPLDEAELNAIAERAGGNPLFLQELVGASIADATAELPETVEAVVASRIDELEPSDRALLRWASVLGPSFSGELITDVLADDPSAAAGSETWDRLGEFIERDPAVAGGFRFRHALIRDAAYEGLSLRRRRELHTRVGSVLEARTAAPEELAELLSLHYALGGDAERTWRFSVLAGARAREKGANIEAAGFYRRALEVARNVPGLTPEDVVGTWEALGDVSELAGRYRDAAEAYRSGRRLAERTEPQPGLLLKEGVMREREGRYADALRWYRRGLDAAESLPAERARRHRVELALAYAGVRHRQGLFRECVRWCESVLDDALESDDLRPLAHAYYLLHIAHTRLGSPEREAYRGLALPIYEELGDLLGQANVLNNLGTEAYYDGRWHVALDLYGRSRALRERIGDVVGAATIANNEAEIRSDQGHLEEADAVFREAYEVCSGAGYVLMCHVATSNLGRVALRAGRFDEAAELLETALVGFRDLHAASFLLETQARIAERHLSAGDAEGAFARAGEGLAELAKAESSGALAALLERVRGAALLLGGDLTGARECLDRSLLAGREAEAPYEIALTLEALADAALLEGGDVEAESLRAESAEIFEHLGVVMRPRLRLRPDALRSNRN